MYLYFSLFSRRTYPSTAVKPRGEDVLNNRGECAIDRCICVIIIIIRFEIPRAESSLRGDIIARFIFNLPNIRCSSVLIRSHRSLHHNNNTATSSRTAFYRSLFYFFFFFTFRFLFRPSEIGSSTSPSLLFDVAKRLRAKDH